MKEKSKIEQAMREQLFKDIQKEVSRAQERLEHARDVVDVATFKHKLDDPMNIVESAQEELRIKTGEEIVNRNLH